MSWGDLLEELRNRIKAITLKIVELYRERISLVERISSIKAEQNIPIRNEEVERDLWNDVKGKCAEVGLDKWNCRRVFNFLISSSIRAQIPKNVGAGPHIEIFRKAKEMEREGRKIYHLEVGEPPWSPPPESIDSMLEALNEGKVRYGTSSGNERFRKAASEWIFKRDGIQISPDQVLPTPGSKFAIFSILSTFLHPGDRIGVTLPAWPAYRGMASNLSLELVEIRSPEEIDKLRGVSAFILCSPNNPDGRVWGNKELEELAEILRESGAILISDDAYAELSFVSRRAPSSLYENSLGVGTLSKAFGMTGFRIGYVYGSKEKISKLAKFIGLTVTNVPEFIQEAAAGALEVGEKWIMRVRRELRSYLSLAMDELSEAPLKIGKVDGGLYLFPKVEVDEFDSMNFSNYALNKKGVAIAPGIGFGPYSDRIRVTFASLYANPGLRLLKEALMEWRYSS